MKNAHVRDIRVIDMLVIKVSVKTKIEAGHLNVTVFKSGSRFCLAQSLVFKYIVNFNVTLYF